MLEALILALHVGPPAMQVVAMAAVWNLCVVAEVRGVLVQVGGLVGDLALDVCVQV